MLDLWINNLSLRELERDQFLSFPPHTNATPLNRVPMAEPGYLSWCVRLWRLYMKLCYLSWWVSLQCLIHTEWSIRDACMNRHWIVSMNISMGYFEASLHHHLPPLHLHLPAVSPDIPFPFWPQAAGARVAIYNSLFCLLDWWSGQRPRHLTPCQIQEPAEVLFLQVPVIWRLD